MSSANSIPQYPIDSLELISNRGDDLVDQTTYPVIGNVEVSCHSSSGNEKCSTQFPCVVVGCNKTYASVSGLNNHMKK